MNSSATASASYQATRAWPIPAVLATALMLVVGVWPLLVSVPAPLQDWPNHLARVHILDDLLRGGHAWMTFYRTNLVAVPNVALDVGVLAGMRAGLSDAAAGQAFLLLTYAVFVGGFCALARRFGRIGPARVAAGIALFYTPPLFWGLVNYTFALGASLGLLAIWLGAGARGRLTVAVLGTALLFFCHLIAAAAFVVTLGCLELVAIARAPSRWHARLSGRVTCLAAGAALVGLFAAAPADQLHEVVWNGHASVYAFVRWKIVVFAQLALNGGNWPVRYATLAGTLAAAVAAGLARPRTRVALGTVAAAAALVALTIVSPQKVGSGSLLDDRLAIVPALLIAAAIRPRFVRARAGRVAGALLVATALARVVALALVWRGPAAEFRDYDTAIARLPAGTMLLMARGIPSDAVLWPKFWAEPYTSIEMQGVAHGDFVPMVFSNPAQQPLALDPRYEGLKQPLDLSDAAHEAESRDRLLAACAGDPIAVPMVAVTVLYAPHARRFAGELYRGRDLTVIDGCAWARSGPQ